MKTIIILTILTILPFIGFLILLIIGLIKKRKSLIIISIIIFIISIGFGGWTGLTITKKTINKAKETLKPRTGDEIYDGLFGHSDFKCTDIQNYQDMEFPIIDFAIVMKFKTCPQEFKRILNLHEFSSKILLTKDWDGDIPCGVKLDWLNPKSMGDTIMVYEYSSDNNRKILTFWTSLDSTQVYCREIND
jgi:hypothetical protein